MYVYIYQADIYCEECGRDICDDIPVPPGADLENEYTWDSDEYPKGPYPDGGGEANTAQFCAHCRVPLDNPVIGEDYE